MPARLRAPFTRAFIASIALANDQGRRNRECCAIVGLVRSRDTTAVAASLHEESYRQLGMAGRMRIALELSDFTHALALAGVKRRIPAGSDEEARRRLAELLYGPAASTE